MACNGKAAVYNPGDISTDVKADLQQQVARLQALLEASRQVHATIHEEDVLKSVLRLVVRELEMAGATFKGPELSHDLTYGGVDAEAGTAQRFPLYDRDGQRMFLHTEVADAFEGRGLATILITEALQATRDAGLRIVAVCTMVAAYVDKHHEFDDAVDPVSRDIKRWLAGS